VLTVRADQVGAMEAELFERWMVGHLRQFFPTLSADWPAADLRQFIRAGMTKARSHGFHAPDEMAGFVDLMLVLGEAFDQDPALPWAQGVLTDPGPASAAARLESLRHFAHERLTTGTVTSSVFAPPETPAAPVADQEPAAGAADGPDPA
jgi:hypothetical protein